MIIFIMRKNIAFCLLVLMLFGCGTQNKAPVRIPNSELYQKKYSVDPSPAPTDRDYYRIKETLQCVPYAREVSGVQIFGNAHTWWVQAQAKGYKRGAKPKKGAVMVLSKTSRLRYGHVAVVKNIIDSRNIEVTHSNWGSDRETRRMIYNRMRVVDVSDKNDWSAARFWNYPSSSYGSIYAVSGFIYPNKDSKPTIGND